MFSNYYAIASPAQRTVYLRALKKSNKIENSVMSCILGCSRHLLNDNSKNE